MSVLPPAYGTDAQAQISNEPYGLSWSGDTATAPSKDAVYNKLETVSEGATDATDILHGIYDAGNETLITINANTQLYDVAPFDYYLNGIKYSFAGVTGRPANFSIGDEFMIINIGSAGLIELPKNTFNNPGTLNTALELGGLGTEDGLNIAFAGQSHFDQDTAIKDIYRWSKFARGTDYIATAGSISESATPRQLDIAGGSIIDPDMKLESIVAGTNIAARPYYHVAGDWAFQPVVTPLIVSNSQYDNGTGLTTVSNNKWMSHNILRSARTDTIYYVPSQAEYATEAEAIDADVSLGGFEGQIGTDVSPLAKIIIQQGSASINQVVDVRNQATNIVSASTSTLQTTYDRSTEPEIVTTVAKGALTIKGGTGVDTDNVYEGKDNAGNTTFAVRASGDLAVASGTVQPWGVYNNITLAEGGFSVAAGDATNSGFICSNVYYDGTNWRLIKDGTGYISSVQGGSEAVILYNVLNGTAGSIAVFEENFSVTPTKVTLTTSKSTTVQRNKSTAGDASFIQLEGSTALPTYIGTVAGNFTVQTSGNGYSDKLVVTPTGEVLIGTSVELPNNTSDHVLQTNGFLLHKQGWRDLVAPFTTASAGGAAPTLVTLANGVRLNRFGVGDSMHVSYHVDHDYAEGTLAYHHVHWFPETAMAAGETVTWRVSYVIARGHDQGESLLATRTVFDVTYTSPVGGTVAGGHIVSEASLAQAYDLLEPDTVILAEIELLSKTFAGNVIGVQADLHYLSDREVTIGKRPDFNVPD